MFFLPSDYYLLFILLPLVYYLLMDEFMTKECSQNVADSNYIMKQVEKDVQQKVI